MTTPLIDYSLASAGHQYSPRRYKHPTEEIKPGVQIWEIVHWNGHERNRDKVTRWCKGKIQSRWVWDIEFWQEDLHFEVQYARQAFDCESVTEIIETSPWWKVLFSVIVWVAWALIPLGKETPKIKFCAEGRWRMTEACLDNSGFLRRSPGRAFTDEGWLGVKKKPP